MDFKLEKFKRGRSSSLHLAKEGNSWYLFCPSTFKFRQNSEHSLRHFMRGGQGVGFSPSRPLTSPSHPSSPSSLLRAARAKFSSFSSLPFILLSPSSRPLFSSSHPLFSLLPPHHLPLPSYPVRPLFYDLLFFKLNFLLKLFIWFMTFCHCTWWTYQCIFIRKSNTNYSF